MWCVSSQLDHTSHRSHGDLLDLVDDIILGDEVMTDGCGIVSRALMRLINDKYIAQLKVNSSINGTPSAFQARFGPFKGMFVEWPDTLIQIKLGPTTKIEQSSLLQLLVRQSQKKYNMGNPDLEEQCAVEILNVSKPVSSGYLSQMYVPLLWQRGVEKSTFDELAREAFVHHVERAVVDEETTLRSILRIQQEWRKEVRRHNPEHKIQDEESWDPPYWITSGLIMSGGFSSKTDPLLAQRMLWFAKQKISRFLEENRIPMSRSRSLFMVPDECGVLGPDECFIQLSSPRNKFDWENLSSEGGPSWDFVGIMTGPIVALRSPSYHHSDVLKLNAVDNALVSESLGHLRDVIVLSTKKLGTRSTASIMSGGDFDGDKVSGNDTTLYDPDPNYKR